MLVYPLAFRSVLAFNRPREAVIRESRDRFRDNSVNLFGYENDNADFNQSRAHVFLFSPEWRSMEVYFGILQELQDEAEHHGIGGPEDGCKGLTRPERCKRD
jgi:hypothetical protein